MSLKQRIDELRKSEIKNIVDKRLAEFSSLNNKNEEATPAVNQKKETPSKNREQEAN